MAEWRAARGDELRDAARRPTADEQALDEAARGESLRDAAPGTVGTRVVIRECGNVSHRGRFGESGTRS